MTLRAIKSREAIKRFYDDPEVVERYLERRTAQPLGSVLHRRQIEFLNDTIARQRVRRVLDLAPGPARLGAELETPPVAIALDFSWNMLAEARRRTRARGKAWQLVQGDGYQLPFGAGTFDLVYSLRFVRRFERPERNRLYGEIQRVLRTDGLFVMDAQNRAVALPHRISRGLEKYPVYDELFERAELIQELRDNGFAVIQLEGIMRRFDLQSRLNRLRRFGLSGPARVLIRMLEWAGDENPSTWMVLCRKSG
ncbi:MAG TPA: methyltransferase domain-containing protein [Candidatus Eisenbacteria bacterium]|nr:methyltransferase domain-containing protein [Candidatus Eisenbacteria bacterium]